MTKKMITALMLACLLPLTVHAAEKHVATVSTHSQQIVHVGVDGMVCDFCAQSLTKLFLKEKGVEKVDISLEKKLMTLTLKDGSALDDARIKKLVDYSGYKVTNIHRM